MRGFAVAAAVVLMIGAAPPAVATEELFVPPDRLATAVTASPERVLRSRIVGMNLGAVDKARAASAGVHERAPSRGLDRFAQPSGEAKLRLNLFQDVEVTALVERAASTFLGGYSISGGIAGDPAGSMALVVNGDTVAGTVRTATGVYSIRSVRGAYVVSEIEELPFRCLAADAAAADAVEIPLGEETSGVAGNGARRGLVQADALSAAGDEASDRAALVALYEATSGASWGTDTNWATDEPLSSWHGVNVNGDGRVTEINLPNNRLRGELPAALGDLKALNRLDLQWNPGLGGALPAGLPDLPLRRFWILGTDLCATRDDAFLRKLESISFRGLACPPPDPSVIDVAVFYTAAVRKDAGGERQAVTQIELMAAETNGAYATSEVRQRIRLVAVQEVDHVETAASGSQMAGLRRLRDPNDGHMDHIPGLLDDVAADMVMLIVKRRDDWNTGISWVQIMLPWEARVEDAYGAAPMNAKAFAHELGHLMGLLHDRYRDCDSRASSNWCPHPGQRRPLKNAFPYGFGYVNQRAFDDGAAPEARWITIMAYDQQCREEGRFECREPMIFSNPDVRYAGDPLGIPGRHLTGAVDGPSNAARAMNRMRETIAAFRTAPSVTASFGDGPYTADEGGDGVTVSVSLSEAPSRPITIPLVATSASGVAGYDYEVPRVVRFGANETTAEFTVRAVDDEADDDGESVTVSFGTPLPAGVSAGAPESALVSLVDDDAATDAPSILRVELTSSPRGVAYAIGERVEASVRFDQPVVVSGVPRLALRVGGELRHASHRRRMGEVLLFSYVLVPGDEDADGVSIGANALSLDAGSIVDAQQRDANLGHSAIDADAAHAVDAVRPTLRTASVNLRVLTLTYSESLDEESVPGGDEFAVRAGGAERRVDRVDVDDTRVVLTLDEAVAYGAGNATIDYTPGTSPIRDQVENAADGIAGRRAHVLSPPSDDAALKSLSLTGVDIGAFDPETLAYTVTTKVESTTVAATPRDAGARSKIAPPDANGSLAGHQVELEVGETVVAVTVRAENGRTTRTYTVTLTRAGSDDAALAGLSLSDVDIGAFDAQTLAYVGTTRAESTTVTATPSDRNAAVAITPVDADGSLAGHQVALRTGETSVGIAVTAEDGATTQTYTVTVTRAASNDATLAALTLSDVDIGTFEAGTTSYAAEVPHAVESTTVTATPNHARARIEIEPADADADAPGHQVLLGVGNTAVTVTVTAEDDAGTRTYTVAVTRAKSDDATLSALSLSGVDIGSFAGETTSYAADVAHAVETTTVTATPRDGNAAVAIVPADADGVAPGHQVALAVGDTTVMATVTADDGATTRTYAVTVTRAPSDDATLAALSLSDVDIGAFASGATSYKAEVANDVESTTVAATPSDDNATVEIAPADADTAPGHQVSLTVGETAVTATVTAADGETTATYAVAVTRAASDDATLSSLSLSDADIGAFDPETLSYEATTEAEATMVSAEPNDAEATVSVGGATQDGSGNWEVALSEGDNAVAVTVVAEDGETVRTYAVAVRRAPAGTAACRDGTALADPAGSPGLVRDCETLLALKDELDPTGEMYWGDHPEFSRLDLGEWDAVVVRDGRVRGIAWDGTDSMIQVEGVLPAALGELDALEVLRLDRQSLRGTLPESLRRLKRLEVLSLQYTDMDAEPLPAWLGDLGSLRELRLIQPAPGPIPDAWSALAGLEELRVGGGRDRGGATGPVPDWLGELPALRRLRLGQQRLTGRIPLSLARGFDALDLQFNALEGCVPAQLAEAEDVANVGVSTQGPWGERYRLPDCALAVEAVAGAVAEPGEAVTLSAVASGHHEDATLAWSWRQADNGAPSVALTGSDTASPWFAVPERGAADAELAFEVAVSDLEETSGSAAATVAYRVPGFAGTASPVVSGPGSYEVEEGETAVATLEATDPDTAAEHLSWRVSGGADASRFALEAGGALAFAAAKDYEAPDDADGDGTYEVSVQVSDGLRSSSADLSVALTNRNEAPAADAGADQADIEAGSTVTLSGSATDPDAGDALTYAWTQLAGPAVALSDAGAAETTFESPAAGGRLTFRLRATDAGGLYGEDDVGVAALGSDDAALSALALSGLDIGPFDADTTSYAADAAAEVTSTTVTTAAREPAARVAIRPSDADPDATGHQVNLAAGETAVAVTVTAADGETIRTYTVTVTRATAAWGDRLPDRDIDLDGDAFTPSGMWSDGDTLWVSSWYGDGEVRAFALDGARRAGRDIAVDGEPMGLWSDGSTLWVADYDGGRLRAHRLSDGTALPDEDVTALKAAGNRRPTGLWSDGARLWAADYGSGGVYAYRLSDGGRDPDHGFTFDAEQARPMGLWSDGETALLADWAKGRLLAYRLSDGRRLPNLDIATVGSGGPLGLFSANSLPETAEEDALPADVLWASDETDGKLYAYAVPSSSADGARGVAPEAVPDPALAAELGVRDGGDPGALTELDIAGLGIADLTGIEAAEGLRTLDISGNAITDLGPLAGLHALEELDVGGNLYLDNLAPLSALRNLRVLRAADNAISDLGPLARLPGLVELDLSGNMIRDAVPLAALGGLRRLNIGGNAVADAAPLAGLSDAAVVGLDEQLALPASSPTAYLPDRRLRSAVAAALGKPRGALVTEAELGLLTALDAPAPGLVDLRELGGASRLRALRLEGGRIDNLWPLAEVGGLRRLHLRGNAVADVEALSGLAGLRVLELGDNAVEDLRPLAELSSLQRLDLGGNPVGDLTPLGDLEGLVWLRVPDARGVPVGRLVRLRWLMDGGCDGCRLGEEDRAERR